MVTLLEWHMICRHCRQMEFCTGIILKQPAWITFLYTAGQVCTVHFIILLSLLPSPQMLSDVMLIFVVPVLYWRYVCSNSCTVVSGVVVIVVGICKRSQMRTSKCTKLYVFNFWCEYRSWPWLEMHKKNFLLPTISGWLLHHVPKLVTPLQISWCKIVNTWQIFFYKIWNILNRSLKIVLKVATFGLDASS